MKSRFKYIIIILFVCAAGIPAVLFVPGMLRKPVGPDTKIFIMVKSIDPRIEFWQVARDGINVAAKEYGVDAQVEGTLSELDVDNQLHLLEEMIRKKPDAIVLAATDYNAFVPVAEKIAKSGITLVTIDSAINSNLSRCFIATDSVEAGRKVGEKLAELAGMNSEVAVISYIKGAANAIERERGTAEGIAKGINCKITGTYYSGGDEEKSYGITKKLLKDKPKLKGIACLNEPTTVGAARAIKEMGLSGKVRLVGFDSSINEIKLLEEGAIQAIVVQNPFNIGYRSVEMTVRLLKGEKVDRRIDTGSILVTKENMYSVENQKLLFPFLNK